MSKHNAYDDQAINELQQKKQKTTNLPDIDTATESNIIENFIDSTDTHEAISLLAIEESVTINNKDDLLHLIVKKAESVLKNTENLSRISTIFADPIIDIEEFCQAISVLNSDNAIERGSSKSATDQSYLESNFDDMNILNLTKALEILNTKDTLTINNKEDLLNLIVKKAQSILEDKSSQSFFSIFVSRPKITTQQFSEAIVIAYNSFFETNKIIINQLEKGLSNLRETLEESRKDLAEDIRENSEKLSKSLKLLTKEENVQINTQQDLFNLMMSTIISVSKSNQDKNSLSGLISDFTPELTMKEFSDAVLTIKQIKLSNQTSEAQELIDSLDIELFTRKKKLEKIKLLEEQTLSSENNTKEIQPSPIEEDLPQSKKEAEFTEIQHDAIKSALQTPQKPVPANQTTTIIAPNINNINTNDFAKNIANIFASTNAKIIDVEDNISFNKPPYKTTCMAENKNFSRIIYHNDTNVEFTEKGGKNTFQKSKEEKR